MVPFLIGLAESVVAIGALFLLGALKWIESSRPDGCVEAGTCYCERLRPGMIKQPSNTWSNLGFVLVGLILLAMANIRAWRGHFTSDPKKHLGVEVPGIYWHFVDVMWIIVFTTVYIL